VVLSEEMRALMNTKEFFSALQKTGFVPFYNEKRRSIDDEPALS
jgi:hypothetical protein